MDLEKIKEFARKVRLIADDYNLVYEFKKVTLKNKNDVIRNFLVDSTGEPVVFVFREHRGVVGKKKKEKEPVPFCEVKQFDELECKT